MQGLMQHGALTLDKIIDHAAQVAWRSRSGQPLGRGADRPHDLWSRSATAPSASPTPAGLGIRPGDRVGTLAWNTGRHMEAWYGIMGMGRSATP
jgi:fatty-acyl-CoA synthase